jgi:hypothetical protein
MALLIERQTLGRARSMATTRAGFRSTTRRMNEHANSTRWSAPLAVACALALLFLAARPGGPRARVDRIRVDPARAPRAHLEALEGMGREAAARIVAARASALAMRAPADLVTVPGVGTKLLHRWHRDLDFADE